MHWFYLTIAIIAEVIATTALKSSKGFTYTMPSIITIIGYSTAFYFLSITLKYIPIGITYAIWSAAGIILISIIGYIFFGQLLYYYAKIGLFLIILGVIIINLFSNNTSL